MSTVPRCSISSDPSVAPSEPGSIAIAAKASAVSTAKPEARPPASWAAVAAAPFRSRWTAMIEAPASSSWPAIRVRTYSPWWRKNFRSSRGAWLHAVQSQARCLLDAPEPPAEREIGRFDGIQEQRALGPAILDVEERRIAFELGQPERRLEPPDDRLEEIARDRRRVLDLATRRGRLCSR